MKNKKISILGSTGSIGKNVLKVAASSPEGFSVVGLTAGWNIDLLKEQIESFSPLMVSVAEKKGAEKLRAILPASSRTEIVWGQEGNEQVASLQDADMVV